jgi:hypothetical protein
MTKRKRGAPHGNHNALKHGFYSAAFKEHERRALSQLSPTDLSSEVDAVRIALYRFLEALTHSPVPLDVHTQLSALRAVNLSAQSITGLIHAEALLALLGEAQVPGAVQPLQPGPALIPSVTGTRTGDEE